MGFFGKYKSYKKNLEENRKYIVNLNRFAEEQIKKDFVVRLCPICNSKEGKVIFRAPVNEYIKCKTCGLVYAKKILGKDITRKFYENNHHNQNWWKRAYPILLDKKKNNKLSKPWFLSKILKFSKGREKCLEIGCGFGDLLFHLKPYFKSVEGVELNIFTSEVAGRLFGVKVHTKELNELKLKKGSYDCIILHQVIEHLDNFGLFYEVYRLLKHGGVIYIGCPYADSLSMKLFKSSHILLDPEHINMFNFKSFNKFADKYNLRIESIETDNDLDIQLNDLVLYLFNKKKFIHRFNDVVFLNPINLAVFFFSIWFLNKTRLLSRYGLGSYLQVVLRKK